MFYRIRNKIKKGWFDAWCAPVLRAPPIKPVDDHVVILSAVGNQDILMYLVAIKSFYHFFKRGRIVVLIQDSCPRANLEVLSHHVNPTRILRDSDVDLGRCPGSGAWGWERLVAVVSEAERSYVIQLDSDTVTVADVPEVKECVNANRSFTIGTWSNQEIEPMRQSCDRVRNAEGSHVQLVAERNFDKLPGFETYRYARGQSSFTGFARGSCSLRALEQFSEQMEGIIGQPKWSEWGSESVASNFVIANSPDACVLPYPKYATYRPKGDTAATKYAHSSLIHFEGTYRFKHGIYVRSARRTIALL